MPSPIRKNRHHDTAIQACHISNESIGQQARHRPDPGHEVSCLVAFLCGKVFDPMPKYDGGIPFREGKRLAPAVESDLASSSKVRLLSGRGGFRQSSESIAVLPHVYI